MNSYRVPFSDESFSCEDQPCGDELNTCYDFSSGYSCVCRESSAPPCNGNGIQTVRNKLRQKLCKVMGKSILKRSSNLIIVIIIFVIACEKNKSFFSIDIKYSIQFNSINVFFAASG